MAAGTSRRCGCGVFFAIVIAGWILGAGVMWFMEPVQNGCTMTYMYPTYIPISTPPNMTSSRYHLYLYHEGWKKIDNELHLVKLSGVPVLFIPGNGGSYKQVRSIAAESDRAFYGGPFEESFYQPASFTPQEAGSGLAYSVDWQKDIVYTAQEQYVNKLDWFAVDLEGEHSAMDGRILEENTDYVVFAIGRILDRYRESLEARSKQTKEMGEFLPTSVILVGHSMGGFAARAALVHPQLRKGTVETIVTLSSPHLTQAFVEVPLGIGSLGSSSASLCDRSAPLPLQPSLGHYYNRVNEAWRKGYEIPQTRAGRVIGEAPLSKVVVVSIFGGTQDYQVRSRFASLDGIVPPTHGMTIGAPGMINVWLSTEHQSILWCNQLVVQVAHTLLQLIDKKTGQAYPNPTMRLAVFVSRLRSALPQAFEWLPSIKPQGVATKLSHLSAEKLVKTEHRDTGLSVEEEKRLVLEEIEALKSDGSFKLTDGESTDPTFSQYACPKSTHWVPESHEKDLFIETPTVTVLAMDGKRRWLDIKKMAAIGRYSFAIATNLAPCLGVRVHLWPEKDKLVSVDKLVNHTPLEVTMKIVQVPSGPVTSQIEPGGQTEQAPPSAVLRLSPTELHGYRFLTISVAPRPTVSGRPPPAASMAVGQFYNPIEGDTVLSPWWLLHSMYKRQSLILKENHPLVVNFSMAVSLGTLPMSLEVKTTSCGLTDSVLAKQKPTDSELMSLCKLRCFPPVVLVWDPPSGLEVFPNLYGETVTVDSSPAMWGAKYGSEKTTVFFLSRRALLVSAEEVTFLHRSIMHVKEVDPHCEYKIDMKVSAYAAASRFMLMHLLQVGGASVTVLLFALMRQARAWELDAPLPSILSCLEANLTFPFPFITLALGPLVLYVMLTVFGTHVIPPLLSFIAISSICYMFANGVIGLLALCSMAVLYTAASLQVFFKVRWQSWEDRFHIRGFHWLSTFLSGCSALEVVRTIRGKPSLTVAVVATVLVFFVHPALGLLVLLLAHAWNCHGALCRYILSHFYQKNLARNLKVSDGDHDGKLESGGLNFGETQLEVFHQLQGLLLLHFAAAVMLGPSLVAWLQRPGMDRTLPSFVDSSLSFGLILHGLYASNADANINLFSSSRFYGSSLELSGLSFIYGVAGLYCYFAGLALAPYRAFHALAVVGVLTTLFRLQERRARGKGEPGLKRRHFHRH